MDRLRQEENVKVTWAWFPLHPETPMEGRSLTDLFKGREDRIQAFQQQMKTLMDEEGLPYGDRSMTYNSRLAQELGAWADTQDGGEALHKRLYQAYFVDNLNISDIPTLVSQAEQAGLDAAAAEAVLKERTFSDVVDRDWQRA
ncbi:MAG: DsbA family protein, partial [Pseudomonadales bacterium]|nr:DsbA family protein [Pseudomonadales bacterium]